MESLARDKHDSLLGPLKCYKENEVLLIYPQGLYSQHFIFVYNYKEAQ